MLYVTALPLRTARHLSCRTQSNFRAPSSAAYSSTQSPARSKNPPPNTQPNSLPRKCLGPRGYWPVSASTRHSSTVLNPVASQKPSSKQQLFTDPDRPLDWDRFFALRRIRRNVSLSASLLCAAGSAVLGVFVVTSNDFESVCAQTLSLDPIMVMGMSTIASGAIGWLIGPFFANAMFGIWYRSLRLKIAQREREFYSRIKQHRADPSNSSYQNPVPDYYAEKVGSVADYRLWLKDQRAFNLKKSGGF